MDLGTQFQIPPMSTLREKIATIRRHLQDGRVVFFHSPQMWAKCNLPVDLQWESVKFGQEYRDCVPADKFGVYAFMLEPNFMGPPKSGYLLYIGKTERDFRERYGEYLTEEHDDLARSKIAWMFERWTGHIFFHYAAIEKKHLVDKTEDALLHACIPPCNTRFKGTVGRAIAAFT